jgi:hypothetical protein
MIAPAIIGNVAWTEFVISTRMTTAVTGLCTTPAKKHAIAIIMTSCGSTPEAHSN